jgi:hypothetical protein
LPGKNVPTTSPSCISAAPSRLLVVMVNSVFATFSEFRAHIISGFISLLQEVQIVGAALMSSSNVFLQQQSCYDM